MKQSSQYIIGPSINILAALYPMCLTGCVLGEMYMHSGRKIDWERILLPGCIVYTFFFIFLVQSRHTVKNFFEKKRMSLVNSVSAFFFPYLYDFSCYVLTEESRVKQCMDHWYKYRYSSYRSCNDPIDQGQGQGQGLERRNYSVYSMHMPGVDMSLMNKSNHNLRSFSQNQLATL